MADDLISVLTEDHQELNGLLLELEVLSGGEHLQRVLTDQLIIESVRHAVAEECYLYPLYRTRVPGGQEIAEYVESITHRLDFATRFSWRDDDFVEVKETA